MSDNSILKRPWALLIMLAAGIVIACVEAFAGSAGTLLLLLIFWAGVAEGAIALVAAAELSNAKWIEPVKRSLLSVYYLIALIGLLFLLMWMKLDIYPWAGEQNAWLNKNFFMVRNFILFIFVFAAAAKFARASLENRPEKKKHAVIYLLVFVLSQSLIAFDWVMSLEYPWFSTLLGGYFFVEAVYAGIAQSALFCLGLAAAGSVRQKTLRDVATMLFGFSLFWAGLFYAQFLVIWYGNLPEETGFVLRRVYLYPYNIMARIILASLFAIPFAVLLSRRVKTRLAVVAPLAVLVLSGLFLEKLLLVHPAAPVRPVFFLIEFLCMALAYGVVIQGKRGPAEAAADCL